MDQHYLDQGLNRMIVTYDIVVDLSVRQYRVTDLAQRYRCVVLIVILTNQLDVCTTRLHK